MTDYSYIEALGERQGALAAECNELLQTLRDANVEGDGAAAFELAARTEELRRLEADSAKIWAMLQEAKGKSSKA